MRPGSASARPGNAAGTMLGRLVHRADIERLLGTPPRWRSAHFAMHHVAEVDPAPAAPRSGADGSELSTIDAPILSAHVDNISRPALLGVIAPKRHAPRAVTRNLVRRIARAVFAAHCARLPGGHWLLRLRAPFVRRDFPAAASPALAQAIRAEVERLVLGALPRVGAGLA